MDDSVIKVLRRSGSWQKAKHEGKNITVSNNIKSDLKFNDDDFKLDEKFEILAKEIKKRMHNKDLFNNESLDKKKQSNNKVHKLDDTYNFEDLNQLKVRLLPYLRIIENLINKRKVHLDHIASIDNELDTIYEGISEIKNDYLTTINKLKQNMSFFDDSLNIIKSAKDQK